MISYKNILFDMGNVLVTYNPEWVIRRYTEDEELIREVKNIVFNSQEWLLLDAGLIEEEKAERNWMERLSSDKARELAHLSFQNWHLYNMKVIPGTAEMIRALKENGKEIYLLSNASMRLLSIYKEVIPAVECFSGIFYSAAHKCVKPQDIIYERFLKEYSLKPSDCFFIDDLEENISAAKAVGISGAVMKSRTAKETAEILGLNIGV
ncbi:HAD family hydrolase [Oribacterium sp. oral taxon 108]|uniref:HAD family hydrolase n=1 Tax=Oribacterium sp. oral taxon 108 TaxID=712414 RepID=UPI00020DD981|nr:HAD family phosphatase [Oribacterium sp. oral taxon 108]EGL37166.1 HAD hydrolase, family IA, variant 3 [Oribacterium sp. oral taxon 108 str. F0425]